ncbi:copper chaperone PCu(A)C [Streptomyces sp. WMMC500]|uniref:copper chaperone PCu(A)C n=1 Tax=Streptomyces sp. WMMC500 TaxID=3015154 RepID=UPI00248B582A|nr:copper chaperone PCu(A)C [Streptomyces sp. WMMC500]WBB61738.1 copper chaperone PCu(A)C [Streptomyces sp. WMMC500]
MSAPDGRRLGEALRAVAAPVVASAVALAGLSAWVASGNAGVPARIDVVAGSVYLPYGELRHTSAMFVVSNAGDVDDRLIAVTSPAAGDRGATLARHRATAGGGAAFKEVVGSAVVPARGSLEMDVHGVTVLLTAPDGWEPGDTVPFTLHFEDSGRVETEAIVVLPGGRR